MSRGMFGETPSYGTLSSDNVAVSYGRPSRYQDGELLLAISSMLYNYIILLILSAKINSLQSNLICTTHLIKFICLLLGVTRFQELGDAVSSNIFQINNNSKYRALKPEIKPCVKRSDAILSSLYHVNIYSFI